MNAEVTTDGARLGVCRVGFSQHYSPSFNHVESFPYLKVKNTKILLSHTYAIHLCSTILRKEAKVLPLKTGTLPRFPLRPVKGTRENPWTGSNFTMTINIVTAAKEMLYQASEVTYKAKFYFVWWRNRDTRLSVLC